MDARLTKANWIDHGLRTLAKTGAGGLKVGALAEAQNVSRGSFYWHFRDFADFRSAILQTWRERTVDQIIREFDTDRSDGDRLKRLVKRAFFGKRGLDRAIRIWAAGDPAVAAVVAEVDASRIDYMSKLLVDAGVEVRDARSRAAFVYWAYLGQATVMDPDSAQIDETSFDRLVDLLGRQEGKM